MLYVRSHLLFYRILWTTIVDASAIAGFSTALYVFNFLLGILQVLHCYWFVMIMTVAIRAITAGKVSTYHMTCGGGLG